MNKFFTINGVWAYPFNVIEIGDYVAYDVYNNDPTCYVGKIIDIYEDDGQMYCKIKNSNYDDHYTIRCLTFDVPIGKIRKIYPEVKFA